MSTMNQSIWMILKLGMLVPAGLLLTSGIVVFNGDFDYTTKMLAFAILIVILCSLLIVSWLDARNTKLPPKGH